MGNTAVIFGTQRCGSNFFLSVCRKFDNLLVLGEMYHRGGAFPFQLNEQRDFEMKQKLASLIVGTFKEHLGDHFDGWNPGAEFAPDSNAAVNSALVKFSHRSPSRYYEALEMLAEGSNLVFKIFPEHLETSQMLTILREQRPRVLFLLRDPVDSFISYKKLTETKKPQGFDTSNLKIKFNSVEYFIYKASVSTYYRTLKEFCDNEGLPVSTVYYEWLHADGTGNKVQKVREQMERVFGEPITMTEGADTSDLFRKQDKATSSAQKVLNPSQLPRTPQVILGD